jgi:HEAT repeat protein
VQAADKVAALVNKFPGPDSRAVKGKEDLAEVERVLAELLKGGREHVVALVGLLVEPGKGDDSRARYALHALATHVCGAMGRPKRKPFAEALASTLGDAGRPTGVRAFVIRQLQVAGGKEVAEALGQQLADAELCEPAAQALLAIRDGAAEQFRAALPKVTGKQRLTVVQALGVLRDEKSAGALRKLAADPDRDTRLAALWGVANLGAAGGVAAVLKAADAKVPYERIKATQACLLLAERLAAAGQKREAARVYKYLQDTRSEPAEKYVHDSARKALAALAAEG